MLGISRESTTTGKPKRAPRKARKPCVGCAARRARIRKMLRLDK